MALDAVSCGLLEGLIAEGLAASPLPDVKRDGVPGVSATIQRKYPTVA
jgi:hypothetical protein